jgi:phosphoribosylformylglycinamidine cyclo-ligase
MVELALKPTHLYPNLIMKLVSNFDIHGMAHITGGGLTENIPRSIPENLSASIDTSSWVMPEIFKWLQANGSLEDEDMFRIFNCGIGMVLIVKEDDSIEILEEIKNHNFKCFSIGKLINKQNNNSVVFK